MVWLYDKSGWYVNGSSSTAISLLFTILFPIVFWVLYIVVPTGIWGKTIGKWICQLSVTDDRGNPPGFWRALSRETLKILAIGTAIGIAVILFQTIYQGMAWYDQMCNTQVAFTPRVRLTQTQKNWRKIVNKK